MRWVSKPSNVSRYVPFFRLLSLFSLTGTSGSFKFDYRLLSNQKSVATPARVTYFGISFDARAVEYKANILNGRPGGRRQDEEFQAPAVTR